MIRRIIGALLLLLVLAIFIGVLSVITHSIWTALAVLGISILISAAVVAGISLLVS